MSRRKEKTVPINKDTVMKLYHIQIGEDFQQKDLAEDLNCSKEHLNRILSKGECAESFRDKVAKYLGVYPALLGEEYKESIIWTDLLTEEKRTVAPEDVQTYELYEAENRIKRMASALLDGLNTPVVNLITALGLEERFNSYDRHQQVFICTMTKDYINQLFMAVEMIPRDQYGEYQDWHREIVKEYLKK